MPDIADFFGRALGNFAPKATGLLDNLATFALTGPQGVMQASQQASENARQVAQLAQALNLHNTMSASEKANYELSSNASDATAQQRDFENRRQMGQSVAQGLFKPAAATDPGAVTIPGLNEGDADTSYTPIPAAKGYVIEKDSEAGRELQLTQDLPVSADKWLEYSSQLAGKRATAAQKAATAAALEEQAGALRKQALTRFSPAYYESLYGKGNVDPQMADHLEAFNNRIADALTIDKTRGNTEAIQGVGKDLDGQWQSPWEKALQRNQQKEHELSLARVSSQLAYEDKYPTPSPEEVKAGVASYRMNGTKVLSALHTFNPRLAIAVEQEGAKQGLSPSVLTNEEVNNSAKSKIALEALQDAENLINQPGVANTIGPVLSRYKAFMAGDVGRSQDLRVKTIQDKLSLARQVLGNIHYSARGSANINVQNALKTLFDGDKMDAPTLLNGMRTVRGILEGYANEGQVSPMDQIGLGPSGGDLKFKGGGK